MTGKSSPEINYFIFFKFCVKSELDDKLYNLKLDDNYLRIVSDIFRDKLSNENNYVII